MGAANSGALAKLAEGEFVVEFSGLPHRRRVSLVGDFEIAGAGYAVVYGSKSVDARISGFGSIEYTGNPLKVKSVVNGFGSIKEK